MDRRELDALAARLIEARGDAEAIAATVPPSQVGPTLRRLRRAGGTIGLTMRALEGRNGMEAGGGHSVLCEGCRASFTADRSDARYCSTRCRVAAHRRRVTPDL